MNTPFAKSEVERKRKNVLELCRSLAHSIRSEDAKGEIDSLLDEALDRLAEVILLMKGAEDRARAERERMEKELESHENFLKFARTQARKVSKRETQASMKRYFDNMSQEEIEELRAEFLGTEAETKGGE